jgi:putative ABC transport system permease protein
LLFGVAPALAAAGVSIQDSLKSASYTHSAGRKAARLRQLLVVAELGTSLVLMIGAGLLARSFLKLASTDLEFPPENLLTLRANLAGSRYATAESQLRFYDNVLDRLKRLPMVRQAAAAVDIPLEGWRMYNLTPFQVAGRTPPPVLQRPEANVTTVSRDFFRTLGIPLQAGRVFDLQDSPRSPDTVVVNQAFTRAIFPGENPLNRVLVYGENDSERRTIVGVVGNVRAADLGSEPTPLVYRCNCQGHDPDFSALSFVIRTTGDPHAVIRTAEGQVHAVDRDVPVFDIKTMDERLADSVSTQRFQLALIGTFAVIALVLSALGIYGVLSYLVTRRTREIGIRIAMGAQAGEVRRLVVGESMVLALLAVLAGLGGAWGLTRYLQSMLYGVTALDGATFAVMPVVLLALAIAASLLPARRASRIDPMAALREE